MEISRRDFLKLSAATAGGLLIPMGSALASTDSGHFALHKPVGEGKTVCPYCSCGCGLIIATDADGHIINSEGDPDNPMNRGALDPKSIAVRQLSTSPLRLKKVLYRAPGSDKWEEKSWDWAIPEIAKRIKKSRDETFVRSVKVADKNVTVNRTEGIAWLGGAANNSEDCYIAVKFSRSLGLIFVEHQARLCHSSTVAGLGPSFGRGAMTNDFIDIKNSDCVFLIGSNAAENHPASFTWVNEARKHGAKLVVVDPRYTRSAATADIYAPMRSGTDIAFLGGLMNYAIQNKLYNETYVKYYTNALTMVNPDYRGPADLDGLFSGFDGQKKAYDDKSWQYQTSIPGNAVASKKAQSLDDPKCVFALLKKHYSRYTPEMVEKICGTPREDFLKVAQTFCATGAPDKSGTILYAMGQTQHTVGSQNIRAIAMLQLLLGNIGVPGGGVNAMRGESNVQGSTDMGVLFHILTGYLRTPTDQDPDRKTYDSKFDATCFWANGPRFFTNLAKAWYGPAAAEQNEYAYEYFPKNSGAYSWIPLFEAMYAKKMKGMICMGQNPVVSGPNSRFERKAFENLDWLVVMDLFETETAAFWRGPGVDPKKVNTEVFLLPAADAMEKAGSIATSGRRIQWRPKVANAPDDAKEDIWIIDRLMKTLKNLYKDSKDVKDRPVNDLVWDYGADPNVELVAREMNGYALADIIDKKEDKVLVEKGKVIPNFGVIANSRNPQDIACGCWIYAGYFAPMDDGTGVVMQASKRRGQKDPGGLGLYPFWGFVWPANRHILYNRASAKPDGTPWAENKKLIWWDKEQKKWVGFDVPDFLPTKAPDEKAKPSEKSLAALSGTDPFIMKADGRGWLFAPKAMKEGPFPEHYEPLESPISNPMSKTQINPVVKVWSTDQDKEIGDKVGTPDKYPIVCTTFRLVEHWQAGAMSRNLPWLAEAQPELFVEISHELAAEKKIKNGDKVIVVSARGEVRAAAVVTARWKPYQLDGKRVHHIGMPWHYGWQGLATGDIANNLTAHVGDGNTAIPEYKVFLVDIKRA